MLRCSSSADVNRSALKTLNLHVSSESQEFITLAVAAESLKSSRGDVLHHSSLAPLPSNMADAVSSFKSLKLTLLLLLLQRFGVQEKKEKKTDQKTKPFLLRPGAAQQYSIMHLVWLSSADLLSLSLGRRGHEAAATNQSREEEKNNNTTLMLKNRHVGILSVCVCVCGLNYHCLQQWKKQFISHRKTLSGPFFFFFFALPSSSLREKVCVRVLICLCACFSGPSDDLEGLLQFHDQLPIGFLHLVSEPVLQSVNGRPRDLKHKHR